jgi:hypothetical protein
MSICLLVHDSISLPTPEGIKDFRIRKPLDSSNVEWLGWPVTGEPLMVVEFKGHARYAYIGVTRQKAVAMAYAPSVGRYLNERIKPHYEVVRLR